MQKGVNPGRGLNPPFIFDPPLYPFLVQISHGLLSLLGAKRSKFGEGFEPLFIFDPPLSPFSGKLILPLKKGVRTMN